MLLGSYAPRAISFAAGQAGFTVVLFVLFNILQPVGWHRGVEETSSRKLEDIAIGSAISLGVGLLFWPRGAGVLLRENIATSFSRNADYVLAAERELVDGEGGGATAAAAAAAATAAHRLRRTPIARPLTERSARQDAVAELVPLVAGAARVRRAGNSLSALTRMSEQGERLTACAANLRRGGPRAPGLVRHARRRPRSTTPPCRRRRGPTPKGAPAPPRLRPRGSLDRRQGQGCVRRSISSGPVSTSTRSRRCRSTSAGHAAAAQHAG